MRQMGQMGLMGQMGAGIRASALTLFKGWGWEDGSELKLGSGDKASRGLGMKGMKGMGQMGLAFALARSHFSKGGDGANGADGVGFGANFRGGAVVVNDDLFTF